MYGVRCTRIIIMRPGHGRHSAKGDVKVSDHGVGDVDCGETRRIHDDLLAPGAGGDTDSNDGPIRAMAYALSRASPARLDTHPRVDVTP